MSSSLDDLTQEDLRSNEHRLPDLNSLTGFSAVHAYIQTSKGRALFSEVIHPVDEWREAFKAGEVDPNRADVFRQMSPFLLNVAFIYANLQRQEIQFLKYFHELLVDHLLETCYGVVVPQDEPK